MCVEQNVRRSASPRGPPPHGVVLAIRTVTRESSSSRRSRVSVTSPSSASQERSDRAARYPLELLAGGDGYRTRRELALDGLVPGDTALAVDRKLLDRLERAAARVGAQHLAAHHVQEAHADLDASVRRAFEQHLGLYRERSAPTRVDRRRRT